MNKVMYLIKERRKEKAQGKVRASTSHSKKVVKDNTLLGGVIIKDKSNNKDDSSNITGIEMLTEIDEGDRKGEHKEMVIDNLKELLNNKNRGRFKKINKMKVVKIGDKFRYEEVIEDGLSKSKESKEISDKNSHRFKSSHSGDIIIEAYVINTNKSRNRSCNTFKIASRINRVGIMVEKIKNIDFNKSEIKLHNINDANKL